MLHENRKFLKEKYFNEYNLCIDYLDSDCKNEYEIVKAENEEFTLYKKNEDGNIFIHSSSNPSHESKIIIDSYEHIQLYESIVFFGTGLGYHINEVVKKFPEKDIYIYEPQVEVFCKYLEVNELPIKKLKGLFIGNEQQELVENLSNLMTRIGRTTLIIDMPSYKNILPGKYNEFFQIVNDIIKGKRNSIAITNWFQKKWIMNSIRNFEHVIKSKNILLANEGKFKGKSAILVAAGPSLNDEIENLKKIKEEGLAYIFSVGSAIHTLLKHGIHPDAVTTYDPLEYNDQVFKGIIEENINDIPIIFGSSSGLILDDYPGEKLHIVTSQDSIGSFYLIDREKTGDIGVINDAPSIAIVTLQILLKLGFDKIYLVGQNFAYRGSKRYSEGIDYGYGEGEEVTKEQEEEAILLKGVTGEQVKSSYAWKLAKENMEFYIKSYSNMSKVINTTKEGAFIEGTEFEDLSNVIEKQLKDNIVEEEWFLFGSNEDYNMQYLEEMYKLMDKEYEFSFEYIKKMENVFKNIKNLARNGNFKQLEMTYVKMNKLFKQIKDNKYFERYIIPMNRVYYEILNNRLVDINEEKNDYTRAEMILNTFGQFIYESKKDMKTVDEFYIKIKQIIEEKLYKVKGEKVMKTNQEEIWMGKFGQEYTERNIFSPEELDELYKRTFGVLKSDINKEFFEIMENKEIKILEVGCNVANELRMLQSMGYKNLYGIELQPYACERAKDFSKGINIINASGYDIPFKDEYFDVVFTHGVLIHIPPTHLKKIMSEVYRCSKKYIWGLEYYSEQHTEIEYRGNEALMWKGDFEKIYMELFPNLKHVKEMKIKYIESDNIDKVFLLEK